MRIAGAGCSLADFLYSHVDFSSAAFQKLRSRQRGDGGIEPGKLVFLDDFEKFADMPFTQAMRPLLGDRPPDSFNVGGPAIVALIAAAQMLAPLARNFDVGYYGVVGEDPTGQRILDAVGQTPLDLSRYTTIPGASPFTMVLSDPAYDSGHGERAFVNNIGTSWHYGPDDLPDDFFDADLTLFGATAIVPLLHDHLTSLLSRAKKQDCLTAVTTVFDFRNEQRAPGARWPLGETDETYQYVDILIADREEALSLSGASSVAEACEFFIERGLGALCVTHGPNPVTFYSNGALFAECPISTLPVLAVAGSPRGDTTGCGDNFAGGVLASIATQSGARDLAQAVAVGACAGAGALFHLGGMAVENEPGEKYAALRSLYEAYREQTADLVRLNENFL